MTDYDDGLLPFDPAETEEAKDFSALPNGKYTATVKKVEVVLTKDGTGKRLKIQWAIEDEPYRGRIVFDDQNVVNKSEEAQRIGQGQVKNRLVALGIPTERDRAKMVGRSAIITVKKKTDDYGERNEVTRASPIGGSSPTTHAADVPAKAKRTPPKFLG